MANQSDFKENSIDTNDESLNGGSNFLHENKSNYNESENNVIRHENYLKLKEIAQGILTERYRYMKLKAPGFMDLVVEKLCDDRISMSHYYEQNGDLMSDPDMEIMVDHGRELLIPATYQQDNLCIYQEAYRGNQLIDAYLAQELNEFLSEWLNNISNQGHIVYKAYYEEGVVSVYDEPTFDEKGCEVTEVDRIEDDDIEL